MLRYTAKDGRQGKNNDPSQHQPAPANDVAQPADTDYQGRDYKQIRTYNPLDFLESGVERLGQRPQAHVGDAGTQRGQQH